MHVPWTLAIKTFAALGPSLRFLGNGNPRIRNVSQSRHRLRERHMQGAGAGDRILADPESHSRWVQLFRSHSRSTSVVGRTTDHWWPFRLTCWAGGEDERNLGDDKIGQAGTGGSVAPAAAAAAAGGERTAGRGNQYDEVSFAPNSSVVTVFAKAF